MRAIWYNKTLFSSAGLPEPWQPKTWQDLLTAAQAVKDKLPDVIPINVYAGTGVGEAASMQGFEMLLYGTAGGTLYDTESQKWVVGSQNFNDALGFPASVYRQRSRAHASAGPQPDLDQHRRARSYCQRASSPSPSTAGGSRAPGFPRGRRPGRSGTR